MYLLLTVHESIQHGIVLSRMVTLHLFLLSSLFVHLLVHFGVWDSGCECVSNFLGLYGIVVQMLASAIAQMGAR